MPVVPFTPQPPTPTPAAPPPDPVYVAMAAAQTKIMATKFDKAWQDLPMSKNIEDRRGEDTTELYKDLGYKEHNSQMAPLERKPEWKSNGK